MTGRLVISRARTRARLVGERSAAAGVERQLHALLCSPVAARVGQMADRLPEGEVICLPHLTIRLKLTLAELQGSAAADLWAGQIEAALEQAFARPTFATVQRFASRLAYHAAYMRHRLGLHPAPKGVFSGFGTLDLLSPARAMAEMLAADPGLWTALAGPKGAALDLVRAVLAQGGDDVVQMVLSKAARTTSGILSATAAPLQQGLKSEIKDTRAILQRIAARSADLPSVLAQPWAALSPAAQVMLAAMTLGPLAGPNPVLTAQILTCLLHLIRQSGPLPLDQIALALARLAVDQPYRAPEARDLQRLVAHEPEAARAVAKLLVVLADLTEEPQAPASQPHRAKGQAADAMGQFQSHFQSPFAGVALLLPHLAEDGMGRAFAASDLVEALASLVRSDLFPKPQDSDFLAALTGTARREGTPDRPNPRDLLFIAKARHDAILQTEAGAPRLAAWLTGRFAATLPGLGGASLGFLRRQFFHVGGEVWIDAKRITLRLDPMPLRTVLELAGRFGADLARTDWLMRQSLTLRCDHGGQWLP